MAHFEDDDEQFPFWSSGEVTRLAIFAALAIIPILVAHSDNGGPIIEPAQATSVQASSGQLRAVRVSAFDINRTMPSALGDIDDK